VMIRWIIDLLNAAKKLLGLVSWKKLENSWRNNQYN